MGMRVKLKTVEAIIVACAVLHNIAIDSNDMEPPFLIDGFEEMLIENAMENVNSNERPTTNNIRSLLLQNYFPTIAHGH